MANIFISYKRIDKERVFKIKDQIESALGEKCWIDLDGIESDAQFASVIIRAINEAHIILFMYSKAHSQIENYETDWTIRELNFANEKKKRIVFLNIDNTPLTDWFRLMFGTKQQVDATSDFAINRLLKDLKMWIEDEKQKKRDAEAKRKREEEARRLQEEQLRLINSIKQECTVLNNEETKLDLNRQNLLIRTEKIVDKEQREVLRSSIVGSSPIGKKYQEQLSSAKEQIAKEREQKEQLDRSVASLQQELSEARNTHQRELEDARKAHQKELEAARQKMQHQVVNSVPTADNKKLHIIYSSAIILLLIIFGIIMALSGGSTRKYATPSEPMGLDHSLEIVDTPAVVSSGTTEDNTLVSKEYKSALGVCSYNGPIDAQGQPHGVGEATFTDGRLYRGPFVHGTMEGDNAFFRYDNGDIFLGSFKKNVFSRGRYIVQENGSYFVGTFKGGQPYQGQWYNKNGKKIKELR